MARVLITGDAGFIGYHTTQRFLDAGNEVLGLDALTDYYDPQLKRDRLARLIERTGFTHVTVMLEDRDAIRSVFADYKPEIVVHLAAQAGVRYSIEHPETYISSNIDGTFNLLEAARYYPPSHLLLASTSSVYGGNQKTPFAETDVTDHPVSLYAATKKSTEALAHSSSHLWRIPTTALRFFTVYGPWGRPDMALFKFVDAQRRDEAIDVYGHGRMRRDFTYIDDLVEGIYRLSSCVPVVGVPVSPHDSLSHVAPFRSVNIAGGTPVELLDFIAAIERAVGSPIRQRLLPMQQGDVIETFADPSLLRDLVGGIPETSVSVGVERFVDWHRSYSSAKL